MDDDARESFDTRRLLDAVDTLDEIRSIVANQENGAPPTIRDALLTLHRIAMGVLGAASGPDETAAAFSLADDIEADAHRLIELSEHIEKTLWALNEVLSRPEAAQDD